MDHRTTHYSLWFLFFGVVAALSSLVNQNKVDSTSIWFLATGLIGLIVTRKFLNDGKLARPYDLIVGIIFAAVGAIGILMKFKLNLVSGAGSTGLVTSTSIIGLNISNFFNALVYAVLGFTSLNHGIKGK
ncbi:MAG: hypothetical protein IVW57_13995 [Ktedonobacterales bacterium]|nr:hypothetical protein [Ktedonobacterales bacterium]